MKLELCYFIDIVLVIDYYTGGGGLRVPSTQSLKLPGMGNPCTQELLNEAAILE